MAIKLMILLKMSNRLPSKMTQQLKTSMNLLKSQNRIIKILKIKMKTADLIVMSKKTRRRCKMRKLASQIRIKRIRLKRRRKMALMLRTKTMFSRLSKKGRKTTVVLKKRKTPQRMKLKLQSCQNQVHKTETQIFKSQKRIKHKRMKILQNHKVPQRNRKRSNRILKGLSLIQMKKKRKILRQPMIISLTRRQIRKTILTYRIRRKKKILKNLWTKTMMRRQNSHNKISKKCQMSNPTKMIQPQIRKRINLIRQTNRMQQMELLRFLKQTYSLQYLIHQKLRLTSSIQMKYNNKTKVQRITQK